MNSSKLPMRRDLKAIELEELIKHPPPMDISFGYFLERRAPTKELIQLLRESTDPHVRHIVCYVFDRTSPKSAREPLLEALFDPDFSVREAASDAYAKVGRASDGPIVMAAYRLETSRTAKIHLILAFGAIRYQMATHLLIDLLSTDLRDHAAWSLGQLDGPEVVSALSKELANERDPGMIHRLRTGLRLIEERANLAEPEDHRDRNSVKESY